MNEEFEREVESSMQVESSTVALLNKSEIDQQITTAHKYPRSIKRFRDETLQMVTLNENVAAECIYSLPRGNKVIEGASARFAEVVASAWGNSRAGARVVNDHGNFVTAQGVFHDLEKNVAITYEVQRRITDKSGKRFSDDMIVVTANAACSIALRNAILKGVPKAFWADMYEAARKTVMGDFATLANRRANAIAKFQAYGVTPEQIFATLGIQGVEDISLEHIATLVGIMTAIKDGDTTPEQAFSAPDQPQVGMPQSKSSAKQEKPAQEPEKQEAPASQEQPPQEGESNTVASDGMKKSVRKAMENGALSEIDLKGKFGFGVDDMPAGRVNDVLDWTKNPTGE